MGRTKLRRSIRDQLLNGFVFRNGASVGPGGDDLLGQPLFAVNVPWFENVTNPHRKSVDAWLDHLPEHAIQGRGDGQALIDFVGRSDGPAITPALTDVFAALPRGYGSWRSGATVLVLSVTILAATEADALFWGGLLGEQFAYDLKTPRLTPIGAIVHPTRSQPGQIAGPASGCLPETSRA